LTGDRTPLSRKEKSNVRSKVPLILMALLLSSLTVMASPAYAAAVSMSKESVQHPGDPVHPADVYLIGMEVHYDMTITNTSSTLDLIIKIQDRVPVDVTTSPPSPMPGTTTWWWNDKTKNWVLTDPDTPVTLTPGQSWTQDFHHIIQASDLVPHPTIPEVNIMTNQLLATGSQGIEVVNVNVTKTVQVVQPEISVTKMADTDVSKAGDTINYTITIENTGDWPLGNITVVDNVLGDLSDKFVDTLAPGASDTQVIPYIVHEGDPDQLTNTVTATGVAQGFDATIPGATVSDSATESVDLVEPCINIFKEADVEFSKVGDTINYTITVSNCGDVELVNIQVTDTLAAASPWTIPSLAPGADWDVTFAYVVQEGDPDPLVNTATATGHLQDLPNVIGPKQTSVEVDLVTPGISITKACSPSSGTVGDTITYTITIANTGDVALENVTVSDSLLGDLSASFVDYLAVGASDTHTFYRDIQSGDPSPLVNTATVNATVIELGNPVSDEDSCEVTIIEEFQGCTPGFWKNHPDCWEGYSPTQTIGSVFTIPGCLSSCNLGGKTLTQALSFGGGPGNCGAAKILLRAAVAALLNASDGDINYSMSVSEVISQVNAKLATCNRAQMLWLASELDMYNNYGCPIDAHCELICWECNGY
jgi:uncharacterized repeat protein (TIGR01451 family)